METPKFGHEQETEENTEKLLDVIDFLMEEVATPYHGDYMQITQLHHEAEDVTMHIVRYRERFPGKTEAVIHLPAASEYDTEGARLMTRYFIEKDAEKGLSMKKIHMYRGTEIEPARDAYLAKVESGAINEPLFTRLPVERNEITRLHKLISEGEPAKRSKVC